MLIIYPKKMLHNIFSLHNNQIKEMKHIFPNINQVMLRSSNILEAVNTKLLILMTIVSSEQFHTKPHKQTKRIFMKMKKCKYILIMNIKIQIRSLFLQVDNSKQMMMTNKINILKMLVHLPIQIMINKVI